MSARDKHPVFAVGLRSCIDSFMWIKKFSVIILFLLVAFNIQAQQKNPYKKNRILLLLDGSSSMVADWNAGTTRFKTAGDLISKLMDSVYSFNPDVEFALRVYGHQHSVPEHNCYDTKREVMFSKDNYTQMLLRLESLHPLGVSPIAYSLKQAAEEDFNDTYNYAYSLILITDGGESCGGNICEVVKTLLDKKIQFKPYIVSLVDYAPLRDQYACLGTYLQASNPTEIKQAIGTIASNYQKLLNVPILKSTVEEVKIAKPFVRSSVPIPEVKVPIDTTPAIIKYIIKKVQARNALVQIRTKPISKPKINSRLLPVLPLPIKELDPVVLPKETFTTLRTQTRLRSFGLFWSTPSLKPRPIVRVALPPKEVEAPAIVVAKATPPPVAPTIKPIPNTAGPNVAKPTIPKPVIKEASYTIKTEASKETLLEIYFTDGKGKFYASTPQVKVINAKTGAEVKKFYRTVDANGNPDPQQMLSGDYTLLIGKNQNFRAKNITIVPNSLNKVTIIAVNGILKFHYFNNDKRPIKEFDALVKKNFEPGPVISQHCSEERQYSAGSYHIEINTLPISRRYLDIDFGVDYVVELEEPGFVAFNNTSALGKAALYYQHGDNFSKFYTFDITGNPALQKVQLQPGYYEVRYFQNGIQNSAMEKSVRFYIQSNATQEITLQ